MHNRFDLTKLNNELFKYYTEVRNLRPLLQLNGCRYFRADCRESGLGAWSPSHMGHVSGTVCLVWKNKRSFLVSGTYRLVYWLRLY